MGGTVKSFSEQNGYGFITVEGQAEDMKFGRNDIVGDQSLSPGDAVQFVSAIGGKGRAQARDVTLLSPGLRTSRANVGSVGNVGNAGMTTMGTVKSFSERNGYGFINIDGRVEDIKFGKNDIVGAETLSPGEEVHFVMAIGGKGMPQAKQ